MTENERFDNVFARIERAKNLPAFGYWSGYRVRVLFAEHCLELGQIEKAESAIEKAEVSHLRADVLFLARDRNVSGRVSYLLAHDREDEALELVLE